MRRLLCICGLLAACGGNAMPVAEEQGQDGSKDPDATDGDGDPADPDATDGDGASEPPFDGAPEGADPSDGKGDDPPPEDPGTDPPDDGSAAATGKTTYFRITELLLRDPRFVLGTADITDEPFVGQSVNGTLIPGGLGMDYTGDGFADVSMVLALHGQDGVAPKADAVFDVDFVDAQCLLSDLTQCAAHPSPKLAEALTARWQTEGSCLTTEDELGPVFEAHGEVPDSPCFATDAVDDVVMDLGSVRFELSSMRLAAHRADVDSAGSITGLVSGFLTSRRAEGILLPDYLPLLGGTPLSDYLRAEDLDSAAGPNGEDGYWVHLNFVAEAVAFDEGDGA